MPKLITGSDAGMQTHTIGGSNFTFEATRIEDLGATEYTLVTIVVDTTGSTYYFTDQLREMLIKAVDACQKSPRRDYLLVRTLVFSSEYTDGHQELHGFTPVKTIDTSAYPKFTASGFTPLWDATFAAVGAMGQYGTQLAENEFNVNGIMFVITDGMEGGYNGPISTATPKIIADAIDDIRRSEMLESLVTILVGINADKCTRQLDEFRREANLDNYIDAGEATPGKLAKLAAFVSQSISSQSAAIGTGGPSQNIAATI